MLNETSAALASISRSIAFQPFSRGLLLELNFYLFAHTTDSEQRQDALKKIKSLLTKGFKSVAWNLKFNCQKAIDDGHPSPDLLLKIQEAINGAIECKELDSFEEWKNL